MFEKIKARVKARKLRKKKERLEEIQPSLDMFSSAASLVTLSDEQQEKLNNLRIEELVLKQEIRELEGE